MHAQRAPSPLGKHCEIPPRLRRLNDTERVFLFGNREVIGIVAGDLQEDAAVRPSLVSLPGRVQKARAKSQNGRDPLCVPDLVADSFESRLILSVHRDIAQESEIISIAHALEMQPQGILKRLSLLEHVCVSRVRIQLHTLACKKG